DQYLLVDHTALVVGKVQARKDGLGVVLDEHTGKDIVLLPREMRQVLHGDRVSLHVQHNPERKRDEGKIVEVVERAQWSVVGRYREESGVGWITPENPYLFAPVMVARVGKPPAIGDWVMAKITEPPTKVSPAVAEVSKVLGDTDRPGMEMDVAILAYGLPHEWPDAVREETAKYDKEVRAQDKIERKDLRDIPLVTIDGADARDFDDAVYCEPKKIKNKQDSQKGWRLIVAIADVSHYVQRGSALDKEAKERGTSVYFPRSVIPMLPEKLSNGLCSLNPEVDRLCMVCDMTVSKTGKVVSSQFYEALMRSHARLTYVQAADMLWSKSKKADELRRRNDQVLPHLKHLDEVYHAFAKARKARSVIEFDFPEMRFEFHEVGDRVGDVKAINPYERNDAHKLIEECMIATNVQAAKFLHKHKIAALYRAHEPPSEDRVTELREYLMSIGVKFPKVKTVTPQHYSKVVSQIQNRDDTEMIEVALLRSMMRAEYTPSNHGHFGLALDDYAHFTSPIRRYPDLLVHRAIRHILQGGTAKSYGYQAKKMALLGRHCSETERRADDATREAVDWLQCQYMQEHVGEVHQGVITRVKGFGIFVRLEETQIDGLVHISDLGKDYFVFDENRQQLRGRRSGQKFSLGDTVTIRVARVNLEDRHIDFELVSKKMTRKKAMVRKTAGKKGQTKKRQAKKSRSKKDKKKSNRKRSSGKKKSKGKRRR
ncbi:MAG: ribonuclease R, partial [Gammaproteobacteria bacterium]|nr:ribonuclease R [Gammaproteobacteria bacterium]